MKIYRVKVNGKLYEVELEAVSETTESIKQVEPSELKEGIKLSAPMAGTILNVLVKVGDKVSKGDTVCVLEAMKLENDIKSSVDGVVKQVNVSKGQQVTKGQNILVIG